MSPIDLHIHSAYSDGLLSPEALCALALQKRVSVMALCDHDTLDGLKPMADAVAMCNRDEKRLSFLPAVELSTGSDGRTHILGYGASAQDERLRSAMAEMGEKRRDRAARIIARLEEQGVRLNPGTLADPRENGKFIGRAHIARALIASGVVNTMEQAFDRYLGEGRPAYVALEHFSAAQAIGMLRGAGAVPVLAHPMRMRLSEPMLTALIESLHSEGLMGIEVYHPSASRRDIRFLQAIARRNGMLVTGGSDFHGDKGLRVTLGGLPSGWRSWAEDLTALKTAIAARSA